MQGLLTHLAQPGHKGRLCGENTTESHPKWFSEVSEVLTKVENPFQMLTDLNGNFGFTSDKVIHINYKPHISLLRTGIL